LRFCGCAQSVSKIIKNSDGVPQMFRSQMGVSLYHVERFVPHQEHDVVQGYSGLYETGGVGMSEIVKPDVYYVGIGSRAW
jgi:hypothetical protein